MAKAHALYRNCQGEAHQPGVDYDHCYCAPYWERYPVCSTDGTMLANSGYCKTCKTYYDLEDLEAEAQSRINVAANSQPRGDTDYNAQAIVRMFTATRVALDAQLDLARAKDEYIDELAREGDWVASQLVAEDK